MNYPNRNLRDQLYTEMMNNEKACLTCETVNCKDRKDDVVVCIGDYQPGTPPTSSTRFFMEEMG